MAKIFYTKKQLEPLFAITLFYQLSDIGKFDKDSHKYSALFDSTNGHENVRAVMESGDHNLPLLSILGRNLESIRARNSCEENSKEVFIQNIHETWLVLKRLYNSNADFKSRCFPPRLWDRMSLPLSDTSYYNAHLIDEITELNPGEEWTMELMDYGKILREVLRATL